MYVLINYNIDFDFVGVDNIFYFVNKRSLVIGDKFDKGFFFVVE